MVKNNKRIFIFFLLSSLLNDFVYAVSSLKEQAAQVYFCSRTLDEIKKDLENTKLNQELQEALVPLVKDTYKQQLDAQFNKIFKGHSDWVTTVTCSSDGKYSATGSRDGIVYVHNQTTGESTFVFEHSEPIVSAAFCSNTCLIIAVKSETYFLDLTSNTITRVLNGHTECITSMAISTDSKYVITGSQDKTACLWNTKTGNKVKTFGYTACVTSVVLNKDGSYALIGTENGTVYLWNKTTGKTRIVKANSSSITAVALEDNGEYALIGSEDGALYLWNIATGDRTQLVKYNHEVTAVALGTQGYYAVIASSDNAYIYNLKTGETCVTLAYHTDSIQSVGVSQCGKYVLTGSFDTTACLWNLDYVLNNISLKEMIKKLFLI